MTAARALVESDLKAGVLVAPPGEWKDVFAEAVKLADQHTETIGCRSLDILCRTRPLMISQRAGGCGCPRQRRPAPNRRRGGGGPHVAARCGGGLFLPREEYTLRRRKDFGCQRIHLDRFSPEETCRCDGIESCDFLNLRRVRLGRLIQGLPHATLGTVRIYRASVLSSTDCADPQQHRRQRG